jgi:hypothetical protein
MGALTVFVSALTFVAPCDARAGKEPKVIHLSPRRVEQRIDARGHDKMSLRASAPPPAFSVTVVFTDLSTGRQIGGATLATDMKDPLELPTPAPAVRVKLRGSTPRDFQLDLTLR